MSRLRNFTRGVASGYVQMAANIAFTLISVPLALHYLSKAEFAVWALISQVLLYLALVELGMGPSVSRILADHKDERESGVYGGVMKAGAIVFGVQGLVLAATAFLLAPMTATLLQIEPNLREEFVFLLRANGAMLGCAFCMKIWGTPFWSFQRYDVSNFNVSFGFAVQMAGIWWGFANGWGLRSMLVGNGLLTIFSPLWNIIAGLRLGVFPKWGAWGRIERSIMHELFAFARDIFVMSVGAQLLSASQVIIISRVMGLEAAATWVICSKIYTLAQQAVGRVFDATVGAFTEMFVRGEADRLSARLQDVVTLTASLSVAIGVIAATINESFVEVWSHGKATWPLHVDILLAIFLVVACVSRCQTGISGVIKDLRVMRLIYFLEGVTFVCLAAFAARKLGFIGVAGAATLAMLPWSGLFGMQLTRRVTNCSWGEVLSWLRPAVMLALTFVPVAIATRLCVSGAPAVVRLSVLVVSLGASSIALLWFFGLSNSLRAELIARWYSWRGVVVSDGRRSSLVL